MGDMGEADRPSAPSTAFTALLDRVYMRLVGFARGLVNQEEDARDVVQDVFVDAWHAAKRQTPPFAPPLDEAAVRRWLFHATYWKAISLLRRRRGAVVWESLEAAQEIGRLEAVRATPGGAPSSGFEQRIAEAEILRAALASLEDEEAACLLLHVVQGYTSVEIGQTLQIAPDAVRKRLSRAMQRLRTAYFAHESERQRQHPGGQGGGRAENRRAVVRKEGDR